MKLAMTLALLVGLLLAHSLIQASRLLADFRTRRRIASRIARLLAGLREEWKEAA